MIETLERNMSKQIRISDRLYNHLKAKNVTMSKYLEGLVFEDAEYPKPVTTNYKNYKQVPSTFLYACILDKFIDFRVSYTDVGFSRREILNHSLQLLQKQDWTSIYPRWFSNPLEHRSKFSTTIDNRIFHYLRSEILIKKDDKYYLAKTLSASVISQVETILAIQPAKDIRLSPIKFD